MVPYRALISVLLLDTNRCEELFQWHDLTVFINHNQLIRFSEAGFGCFFTVPNNPTAGASAKTNLRAVPDMLTQQAAHWSHSIFQIICQLKIVLQFRRQRNIQIAVKRSSDSFDIVGDCLSTLVGRFWFAFGYQREDESYLSTTDPYEQSCYRSDQ